MLEVLMATVPYEITVHNIEACNCSTACGCQFSGFPTSDNGSCEALIGGEVKEGKYGDVDLKGVRYIVACSYPKAIHQGNGKVAVFIDDKSSDKQAEAITMILSGQAGGMPWEALAGTIAVLEGPVRKPIEMKVNGTRSNYRIPGVLEMRQTPMRDAVSGQEKEVQIVYPKGGFFWNTGNIATTEVLEVNYGPVRFKHGDGFASYSTTTWTNRR
jgi:hypothetical protein